MAAGPAEKLASALGAIYVACVMPLVSGGGFEPSEMAHVPGYYAGLTYAALATTAAGVGGAWIPIYRRWRR